VLLAMMVIAAMMLLNGLSHSKGIVAL